MTQREAAEAPQQRTNFSRLAVDVDGGRIDSAVQGRWAEATQAETMERARKAAGRKRKCGGRGAKKWKAGGGNERSMAADVLRGDRRLDFPEKKGGCGCVCRDASWVLCSYITTSCELKKIKKIFCAPFNMGVHCTHHTSAVTHNHPP